MTHQTAAVLQSDPATPDAELVEGCRRGDELAVRELTRRYNQRLFRMARSIVRDDAEAEDIVQDTYVRAFTHFDGFRGDAGVGTWLTRIAINEALARVRRRRPTLDIADVPIRAGSADPESAMVQEELRGILERSIDTLPDAFRGVFVARMVEGLSVEETAELFDLRPETVKTRLHRARVRLRRAIEHELGAAWSDAYAFDGIRCERLTARVLQALRSGNPFHPSPSND